MASTLEQLGQRVADLRGRKSQRAVAKDAGLDVSTVSRIERGLLDPSYTTVASIAQALGVPVEALLSDSDVSTRPASVSGTAAPDPAVVQISRDLKTLAGELKQTRTDFEAAVRRIETLETKAPRARRRAS